MQRKDEVIKHFDAYAVDGNWSRLYDGHDPVTNHSFIVRKQRVQELLDSMVRPGWRVLDLGCGTGIMAPYFACQGADYLGVDISQPMIQRADQEFGCDPRFRDRVSFRCADGEGLEFPDRHFDLVIALGLLEYLPDPEATIRQAVRVTRTGGTVLFTVPNKACLDSLAETCFSPVITEAYHLLKRLLGRPDRPGNFYHRRFRPGRLDALLRAHGCRITGRAFYNLEVLFYPLKRLFPRLAWSLKSAAEKHHRTPLRLWATGYICRAEKIGATRLIAAGRRTPPCSEASKGERTSPPGERTLVESTATPMQLRSPPPLAGVIAATSESGPELNARPGDADP